MRAVCLFSCQRRRTHPSVSSLLLMRRGENRDAAAMGGMKLGAGRRCSSNAANHHMLLRVQHRLTLANVKSCFIKDILQNSGEKE